MKVELTKKKLIKIIEKEPLFAGLWLRPKVNPRWDYIISPDDKHVDPHAKATNISNCIGCAVGQSVCALVDPTETAHKVSSWIDDIMVNDDTYYCRANDYNEHFDDYVAAGKWLNALSMLFEKSAVDLHATEKVIRSKNHPVKKRLLKWIKEAMPESFVVDIDGLKPRKGVKIVQ